MTPRPVAPPTCISDSLDSSLYWGSTRLRVVCKQAYVVATRLFILRPPARAVIVIAGCRHLFACSANQS